MLRRRRRDMSRVSTATGEPHYFVITVTNYPNLLLRTQELQQCPNQNHSQDNIHLCISNQQPDSDILAQEQHERELYEELRHNLQEIIRSYIQRTQQSFPIRFVFDFSTCSS